MRENDPFDARSLCERSLNASFEKCKQGLWKSHCSSEAVILRVLKRNFRYRSQSRQLGREKGCSKAHCRSGCFAATENGVHKRGTPCYNVQANFIALPVETPWIMCLGARQSCRTHRKHRDWARKGSLENPPSGVPKGQGEPGRSSKPPTGQSKLSGQRTEKHRVFDMRFLRRFGCREAGSPSNRTG